MMREWAVVFTVLAILLAPGLLPAEISAPQSFSQDASAYPEGLVYTVQQGDTLWDLAGKYLGSHWRWQELWERNRFLTNPHYIYPGIKIVVFTPPAKDFAMVSEEPTAADLAAGPAPGSAYAAKAPGAKGTPPAPPRKTTLDITPSEFVRAGTFLLEKPRGIGAIRDGLEPRMGFVEGDKVYLRLSKEIPAGQLLGVYRVRGPITTRGDRPFSGYVAYLAGVVQVGGKEDGETFGIVRKSFEDLTREDIVSEKIPSYAPVTLEPVADGMEARVIAGQQENEELAAGNFVYLDRGSKAGIAVGNVFRVYHGWEPSADEFFEGGAGVSVEVAQAVVVRVSPEFSTAYLAKSTQSFPIGVRAVRGATTPR